MLHITALLRDRACSIDSRHSVSSFLHSYDRLKWIENGAKNDKQFVRSLFCQIDTQTHSLRHTMHRTRTCQCTTLQFLLKYQVLIDLSVIPTTGPARRAGAVATATLLACSGPPCAASRRCAYPWQRPALARGCSSPLAPRHRADAAV